MLEKDSKAVDGYEVDHLVDHLHAWGGIFGEGELGRQPRDDTRCAVGGVRVGDGGGGAGGGWRRPPACTTPQAPASP